MRRSVRIAVGFFVPVLLVVGCGEKKTGIPTKQDQSIPEMAAPAGGAPTKGKAGGGKKESALPNQVVD